MAWCRRGALGRWSLRRSTRTGTSIGFSQFDPERGGVIRTCSKTVVQVPGAGLAEGVEDGRTDRTGAMPIALTATAVRIEFLTAVGGSPSPARDLAHDEVSPLVGTAPQALAAPSSANRWPPRIGAAACFLAARPQWRSPAGIIIALGNHPGCETKDLGDERVSRRGPGRADDRVGLARAPHHGVVARLRHHLGVLGGRWHAARRYCSPREGPGARRRRPAWFIALVLATGLVKYAFALFAWVGGLLILVVTARLRADPGAAAHRDRTRAPA